MTKVYQILTVLVFTLGIAQVNAQCNTDELIKKASSKLGDFTFLKSYKLNAGGEIENSYVFSKDTKYFLSLSDDKNEIPKIKVTLYDKNRKMLATNYNPKTKSYYAGLVYSCTATGIYYMDFSVEPESKCSVAVVGFKK